MKEQKSGHIINISEGIRLESGGDIRSTNISPGAVANELTDGITHQESAEGVKGLTI